MLSIIRTCARRLLLGCQEAGEGAPQHLRDDALPPPLAAMHAEVLAMPPVSTNSMMPTLSQLPRAGFLGHRFA